MHYKSLRLSLVVASKITRSNVQMIWGGRLCGLLRCCGVVACLLACLVGFVFVVISCHREHFSTINSNFIVSLILSRTMCISMYV